jgi:hypothetical protein
MGYVLVVRAFMALSSTHPALPEWVEGIHEMSLGINVDFVKSALGLVEPYTQTSDITNE